MVAVRERLVDAEDRLPLGHEEAGQVLGEVPALAFVGEKVRELGHGLAYHGWEFDNRCHDEMLHSPTAPEQIRVGLRRFYLF